MTLRTICGPNFSAVSHSGLSRVLGDVAALVDARQYEVRQLLAEDVAGAHDDAVGRRTTHGKVPRADFAQAQRIVQRQRMRNAGLVELRRHDPDVIRQRARNLLDHFQAGRMDAVVIGAENSHPLNYLFGRFLEVSRRRLIR
jgi:hypothetical protein